MFIESYKGLVSSWQSRSLDASGVVELNEGLSVFIDRKGVVDVAIKRLYWQSFLDHNQKHIPLEWEINLNQDGKEICLPVGWGYLLDKIVVSMNSLIIGRTNEWNLTPLSPRTIARVHFSDPDSKYLNPCVQRHKLEKNSGGKRLKY